MNEPLPSDKVAALLHGFMRMSGGQPITITWQRYYKFTGRKRIKEAFKEAVQAEASKNYQMLVVYGTNVVIVAPDSNFNPVKFDNDRLNLTKVNAQPQVAVAAS